MRHFCMAVSLLFSCVACTMGNKDRRGISTSLDESKKRDLWVYSFKQVGHKGQFPIKEAFLEKSWIHGEYIWQFTESSSWGIPTIRAQNDEFYQLIIQFESNQFMHISIAENMLTYIEGYGQVRLYTSGGGYCGLKKIPTADTLSVCFIAGKDTVERLLLKPIIAKRKKK